MNNIEVGVVGAYGDPGKMAGFLARLTQRGHSISNLHDLQELFDKQVSSEFVQTIAELPHGTIKRFTPITIAIVGASRRFLAQARTNQVGFNYVSASLQYSDYSGKAQFVVPYSLIETDYKVNCNNTLPFHANTARDLYLASCEASMETYNKIAMRADNDTAGYVAPQGLRNILIMQGNHQAWDYWLRLRSCNRNTVETQYVTMLIWEALLATKDGEDFFKYAGPDCMYGRCREGKMCCGSPMRKYVKMAEGQNITVPRAIVKDKWPLLEGYNE